MSERVVRVEELIRQLASDFFARESDRTSMITITSVSLSPDFANATIGISVFPEDQEQTALGFAKRKRSDLRTHIKKNTSLKKLPVFDIVIDEGEKNRQRIDELTQ